MLPTQLRIEDYALEEWAEDGLNHLFELKSVILHVRHSSESSNDVPYTIDRICLLQFKNEWHVFSVEDVQDFEREMYCDEQVDTNNMFIDFSKEPEPCIHFEFDQLQTLKMNLKKWFDYVNIYYADCSLRIHMLVYERAL
jgi:hypothetical protein